MYLVYYFGFRVIDEKTYVLQFVYDLLLLYAVGVLQYPFQRRHEVTNE